MVLVISEPLKNQWFFIRFFDLFMHVFKPWLYIEPGSLDLACNFQPTVMYQTGSLGFYTIKKHTVMYQNRFFGTFDAILQRHGYKTKPVAWDFRKNL